MGRQAPVRGAMVGVARDRDSELQKLNQFGGPYGSHLQGG